MRIIKTDYPKLKVLRGWLKNFLTAKYAKVCAKYAKS